MRARKLSFQLEETAYGTFLLQGWFGGILAGFVYTAALCVWEPPYHFFDAPFVALYFIALTNMLGVMKSILMWAPYRWKKFQPSAVTRVALTSIATGVFAFVTGRLYSNDPNNWVPWMVVLVLGGLPTAVLVGSHIKPWNLFTFGGIAGKRVRSVWGTLGTLPLRFMSLLALAVWILYLAVQLGRDQWSWRRSLYFVFPATYLIVSATVTFRSPRKLLLLIIGVCVNIPVAMVASFPHAIRTEVFGEDDISLVIMFIGGVFLSTWAIFLLARLTVRTQRTFPITELNELLLRGLSERDHNCLGSRFSQWHESEALRS
jgi:hypothetical protein